MQKKYKLAEGILSSLLKIKGIDKKDIKSNDNEYARILDNLGLCYLEQGKTEALHCFNKSLTIKLALNDYTGLIYNYKHLSEYFQKSKPSLSKSYAKEAYTISCKLNNTSNKIQSLGLLINSSKGNDLKKYSLKFITLVDSVIRTKQKAKNQFSTIKYDSKQVKQENFELKAQKAENQLQLEKEKNRNMLSSIIILLITIITLLLYFNLKSKGRKEKSKAIAESEMRISKKLSRELTKDMFQTLNFAKNIDLKKNKNKEKLLNNLDNLYLKTRNISKENSTIPTDGNYNLGLKEMISSFQSSGINILLNGLENISFNKIERNTKVTIYRVLQELLVNMKKHSRATLVGINFKTLDKSIIINYTDNGKGIDLNNITFKNGLDNVENKVLALKGEIDIDSAPEKGFKVSIKFPL